MKYTIEKRLLTIFIGLTLLILLIADFISGRNSGGVATNRGVYQVILLFLTLLLLINYVFNSNIKFTPILKIMTSFSLFFLVYNYKLFFSGEILKKLDFLYSIVWILLAFFGLSLFKSTKNTEIFQKIMYLLFYFSVFNTFYGMFYFRDTYDVMLAPGVYTTLVFFPWLKYQNNTLLKKISIIILIITVVLSFKRGAILALIIPLFIGEIIDFEFKKLTKRNLQIIGKSLIIIIMSIITFYVVNIYSNNYLYERFSLEEINDGSGRGSSNSVAIDAILNKSTLESLLIGFDTNQYFLSEFLGHNDWLVYFVNYGIISFLIYAFFYLILFNSINKTKYISKELYKSYLTLFIMMFLISFYSTSYGPTIHPIFFMISIGYFEGKFIQNENKSNNIQ